MCRRPAPLPILYQLTCLELSLSRHILASRLALPLAVAPMDQAPMDQAPVDQAPVDQAPVDQAPVDQWRV